MLPSFSTSDRILSMMQSAWATLIDPILANPANNTVLLPNIVLGIGSTVVNHKLGRKLIGWQIVRQRAAASIYDTQDANQMSNLTLNLVSDAAVVVDLLVF